MATSGADQAQDSIQAGIYARISKDDQGDMLGVRRQERDARSLAERKGWKVVEVFVDDDVSAWSGRKRPAYERLLAALEAREIDAVAVYDLDRLHRQPRDLERFFDTCDKAGVRNLASVAGDVDLAASDGRLLARIMGAVAAKSSDDTSRRIRRKLDDVAAEGRPHGGHRPFGYAKGGVVVDDAEAALLREAAADVLAGTALANIARRWNEAGVPSPQAGGPWSAAVIRRLLARPRIAGLRVHRGEIVGPASWPAILDRATFEQLTTVLNDRGRTPRPGRRNLLSGLLRCGICGQSMTRDLINQRAGRSWRCAKRPGYPHCGRVTAAGPPLERLVVEAVLQALDGPELAEAVAGGPQDDPDAVGTLADVEARQRSLAELYAASEISQAEWLTARRALAERADGARGRLASAQRSSALAAYASPGALREAWPSLDLERQRRVLGAVLDYVTVAPATRRGPIFDDGRVHFAWRA